MKKIIFALTMVLFSVSSNAQYIPYYNVGTTWNVSFYTALSNVEYFKNFTKTKDTIVNGIGCEKIQERTFNYNQNTNQITLWSGSFNNRVDYIYHQNNKIYHYIPNLGTFKMIYDFNAIVGDRWPLYTNYSNSGPVCTPDTLIVDSVSSIQYNGLLLKKFKVHCVLNELFTDSHTIIEKIGSMRFYYFFQKCGPWDEYIGDLNCYNDSVTNFSYLAQNKSYCTSYLGATTINPISTEEQILLYPNPTNSLFTVKFNDIINSILVYNVLKELVKTANNINTVDVSQLENGCYFVQVINSKNTSSISKLIINHN
jgi:hypothetical protein